eukprot:s2278_g2.t1
MDRDGSLTFVEFACAMAIVARRRRGGPVPSEVPIALQRAAEFAPSGPSEIELDGYRRHYRQLDPSQSGHADIAATKASFCYDKLPQISPGTGEKFPAMGDASSDLQFLHGTWMAEFRDMNINERLFTTEVEVTDNVAIFHPNQYQITCSPEGVVELTDGSGLIWWLQRYSPWERFDVQDRLVVAAITRSSDGPAGGLVKASAKPQAGTRRCCDAGSEAREIEAERGQGVEVEARAAVLTDSKGQDASKEEVPGCISCISTSWTCGTAETGSGPALLMRRIRPRLLTCPQSKGHLGGLLSLSMTTATATSQHVENACSASLDAYREFFEASGLPIAELSAIYAMADLDHDGQLSEPEFLCAMALVTRRKSGAAIPDALPPQPRGTKEPTSGEGKDSIHDSLPLPVVVVVVVVVAVVAALVVVMVVVMVVVVSAVVAAVAVLPCVFALTSMACFAAVGPETSVPETQATQGSWQATSEELERYRELFSQLRDAHGFVGAGDAREVLESSGLPLDDLAVIWDLADAGDDGQLDEGRFRKSQGTRIPSALPPELAASSRPAGFDEDELLMYLDMFGKQVPQGGHMSADLAREILESSNLPTTDLSLIWRLSASSASGLSAPEFLAAMVLARQRRPFSIRTSR